MQLFSDQTNKLQFLWNIVMRPSNISHLERQCCMLIFMIIITIIIFFVWNMSTYIILLFVFFHLIFMTLSYLWISEGKYVLSQRILQYNKGNKKHIVRKNILVMTKGNNILITKYLVIFAENVFIQKNKKFSWFHLIL